MRNKQSYRNRREQRCVSVQRLGVKSSAEQQQCVRRRRRREALSSLLDVAGREGRRRWQMAGESGGRAQLPSSTAAGGGGGGGGEEQVLEDRGESVKVQAGPAQCKDPRGKENSAGNSAAAGGGKRKLEEPALSGAAGQTDRSLFFDEDSNHIFPVEQFFGNLDTVQDFSGRTSSATEGVSRREYRRRHYYAKDESDEEET
uniref:Uncharacterized protein n=1 Tax=Astyanax mexicanus TaxID=7994 RepID=A0A3B1ITB9_ASTMX